MNLKRILAMLVVALVAVVVVAGCGNSNSYGSPGESDDGAGAGAASPSASPSGASAGGSGTKSEGAVTVTIQNFTFAPQTLVVEPGTEVTWSNKDSTVHDVTSKEGEAMDAATTDLFASGTMNEGDTFSYTFSEPGIYYYVCTIHATMASMHAKVVVEE